MGTPDFAVPALEALVAAGHDICGVFTQPDKPKNRGMKLQQPPVKVVALSHDIPVFQPTSVRDGGALETIKTLNPELIVVAAYGRILPDEILEYPAKGCINVHSSLLPKFRGAAPINWAIVRGEEETGVTIMHMATEMDAGDIIAQVTTAIDSEETFDVLYARLAQLGGGALIEVVDAIADGTATRTPQNPDEVTFAPMLSRELAPIDWSKSAKEIHNQVRGLTPWPATSTDILGGEPVKVYAVSETGEDTNAASGTILAAGKAGIDVACGDGKVIRLTEVQAQGSRRMAAADYLRGHPISVENT